MKNDQELLDEYKNDLCEENTALRNKLDILEGYVNQFEGYLKDAEGYITRIREILED